MLDCFAGSGTTLEAAHHLNRRWIGIDNSPESIRVILQRFARGLEPMGDFVKKAKSGDDDLFARATEKVESLNGRRHHAPIRDFEMWQSLSNSALSASYFLRERTKSASPAPAAARKARADGSGMLPAVAEPPAVSLT